MLRKITYLALCAAILFGCTVSPTPAASTLYEKQNGALDFDSAPQFTEVELEQIVTSNNAFAWAIFAQQVEAGKNLVVSPYSVYQALGMLYAGAAGETADEMRLALRLPWEDARVHRLINALNQQLLKSAGLPADPAQAFELRIANALWAAQGRTYEQAFLDTLQQNYNSGLQTLDFSDASAAAEAINAWVSEQTNQKITQLAEPGMFNVDTALALTNAAYFKAAWKFPFNEAATTDAPFTLVDGTQQNVPMMHLSETFEVSVEDDLTLVRLPYAGGAMAMEILMPSLDAWNDADGIAKLLSDGASLPETEPTSLNLSLPKFHIETPSMDLIPALIANGMQSAFSDQADFSGISGDQSLYVSTVAQKAFIDVDENGTEAAAATIAVVQTKSMPGGQPLKVTIDHPFIFIIRDTSTGAILFMGTVMQP